MITPDQADKALGAMEKLTRLLSPIVRLAIPDYQLCARDLEDICKRLLDGNENVVRWMNRFRNFDFSQPNADFHFRKLADEYREVKAGRRYQELKFDCREIETIYHSNVSGRIRELFGRARYEEAASIVDSICVADASMVQFVHSGIFESLDQACREIEQALDKSSIDAAEVARLKYKVNSNDLYERILHLGNELTENVLKFKNLATKELKDFGESAFRD